MLSLSCWGSTNFTALVSFSVKWSSLPTSQEYLQFKSLVLMQCWGRKGLYSLERTGGCLHSPRVCMMLTVLVYVALPSSQLKTQIPLLAWKFICIPPCDIHPASCECHCFSGSHFRQLRKYSSIYCVHHTAPPLLKELLLNQFLPMPSVFLWWGYRTCNMCIPEEIPASTSHTVASKIFVYCLV